MYLLKNATTQTINVQCFDPTLLVPEWVGTSPPSMRLLSELAGVAPFYRPLLITGEVGTGKKIAARLAHELSGLRPWVSVSGSTLTHQILDAWLQGGYRQNTPCESAYNPMILAQLARGGTLFIDDVDDLSLTLQARLCGLMQDGPTFTLPPNKSPMPKLPARIICSTHRNLAEMVRQQTFRQDLYHRIVFFTVRVPPLRDRSDDILLLAQKFLDGEGLTRRFSPSAQEVLRTYPWPGNMHELQRVAYNAAIRCDEWIDLPDLAPFLKDVRDQLPPTLENDQPIATPANIQHLPSTFAPNPQPKSNSSNKLRRTPRKTRPIASSKTPRALVDPFEIQYRGLAAFRENACMSAIDFAQKLNISQSTARRLLNAPCRRHGHPYDRSTQHQR